MEIQFKNSAILAYKHGAELNSDDRISLQNYIINCEDSGDLSEAIYIYAYSFPPQEDVIKICRKNIIEYQICELSSACLKAVLLFWDLYDSDIVSAFDKFLNTEDFETFFDECSVIRRFLRSDDGLAWRPNFTSQMERFEAWMRENDLDTT
jgi:hypothetical protein